MCTHFYRTRSKNATVQGQASNFIKEAMSRWSHNLTEMEAQHMYGREPKDFGCNFFVDTESDENGNDTYELCCAFN
ncbi:hypothetical protein Y032_0022g490 [Ancylostoma ceylanicum]|nr:hypothetical protein Y032_0022g490 [Ancylostoma ceylanicum]